MVENCSMAFRNQGQCWGLSGHMHKKEHGIISFLFGSQLVRGNKIQEAGDRKKCLGPVGKSLEAGSKKECTLQTSDETQLWAPNAGGVTHGGGYH